MNPAEKNNQRRASGLAVLVMDHLREQAALGQPVTLWSLNRTICNRYGLKGPSRDSQYAAIRTVVRNLEDAGMIGTRKEWDKNTERYLKYIWPCSAN